MQAEAEVGMCKNKLETGLVGDIGGHRPQHLLVSIRTGSVAGYLGRTTEPMGSSERSDEGETDQTTVSTRKCFGCCRWQTA